MTFKKILKAIAAEFEIPADKITELQDSVTKLVTGQLAPLQEKLKEYQVKEDEQTFASFGELDEKTAKMMKALIASGKGDDESYKDAMNRIAKEYGITPKKAEDVNKKDDNDEKDDGAKPPKKRELFSDEEDDDKDETPTSIEPSDLFE